MGNLLKRDMQSVHNLQKKKKTIQKLFEDRKSKLNTVSELVIRKIKFCFIISKDREHLCDYTIATFSDNGQRNHYFLNLLLT